MRAFLLTREAFKGASELGVPLEDLLPGEVAGLARGKRMVVRRERYPYVRLDAGLADKVAVGRKPLGDAEQDRRAIPQYELREHRPCTESGLPDHGRPVVVPEGAGQDLRARRRPAIHQDRHRGVRALRAAIGLDLLAPT